MPAAELRRHELSAEHLKLLGDACEEKIKTARERRGELMDKIEIKR